MTCESCFSPFELEAGFCCVRCENWLCPTCSPRSSSDGTCTQCAALMDPETDCKEDIYGLKELEAFWSSIKVGDLVRDDLTGNECTIARIEGRAIWLSDESYLGGGRYGWEVSPPLGSKNAKD